MKVLAVGLALFDEMAGGSARYLSGMVDALRHDGHEVRVITAYGVVGAKDYIEPGVRGLVRRTLRRLLLVHPRTFATVVRFRPDVVNVHFAFDGLGAVIAARLLGIPVVVMFQGPWAREAVSTGRRGAMPLSTPLRRFLERRVYRSALRCTVLSKAFRDILVNEYGVAPGRVRVIPAGIDRDPYENLLDRREARGRLGLADAFTLVTVRRLVARMGLDLLLEAMARLPDEPVVRLAIAGSGPERAGLEELAHRLDLSDRVTFLGRVPDDDLPALYAAGDLCVVPTRELEGFGYVALESYAAGTPVVATAVGGLIDLVGAFDPGWLVEPDADALRDRIVAYMAGSPTDRERCRRYAAAFDWALIAPRVVAVFREVADS